MCHGQPARRRGGGRTEDRLDPVPAEPGNGAIEKIEIELALIRLPDVPCELAHADDVEAGLGHARAVPIPIAFIHMFGVVRHAEKEIVEIQRSPRGKRRGLRSFHLSGPLDQEAGEVSALFGADMVRPSERKR